MENETIFILFLIIFVIVLIISKETESEKSLEEQMFNDEQQLDIPFQDRWHNQDKEEQFHHPVTGYKGTRSQMNTYIRNRERDKLKD